MILQTFFKETDRGMEKRIQHTPVLQVFCGKSVLPDWRCPDHTKIEELRNRLTPETHRAIGEYVLRVAHRFGFADASWMDVDSTVQEANISYPADSEAVREGPSGPGVFEGKEEVLRAAEAAHRHPAHSQGGARLLLARQDGSH